MKLFVSALIKFTLGAALLGAMLFVPAGTFLYPRGWLFMAVLFLPMLLLGMVLFLRSPELLARRLDGREKQKAQQGVVALSGLMFPVGFVLSALDFRFGWSNVPPWLTVTAAVIFLLSYGMYAEVMRENAYLSRTVKVEQNQAVISTGLYGVVRHPMYLATLLMFLPLPLILGSFWGLIPFAVYPVLLLVRISNEEKLLTKELSGYAAYKEKVKHKLIPFVW